MNTVSYAKKRIISALEEVRRLKQGEFPYPHARDAFELLQEKLNQQQILLSKIAPGGSQLVANNACSISLDQLFLYLPILGFVLRSTNTRNAFEAYGPLLRLARTVLDPSIKLLISSEWEYSPFVYLSITDLPNFVLIGLPAPESSNPLLLPLAGHELGHWVWQKEKLESRYEKQVGIKVLEVIGLKKGEYDKLFPLYANSDLATDMFARLSWLPAYNWALLQIQETFCDFLGVRIFAESYLNAFAYFIAPRPTGLRALNYPNNKTRAENLIKAANFFNVNIPLNFRDLFEDQDEPNDPTKFLVAISDSITSFFVQQLIVEVDEFAKKKNIPIRNEDGVKRICSEFEKVVPAAAAGSFADIINAGWECNLRGDFWNNIPQIAVTERDKILSDLILKTVEVFEIEERLKQP